ncbi:MAG: multiubiquitin domain-containing protein [Dehalococcoidia bacterium]
MTTELGKSPGQQRGKIFILIIDDVEYRVEDGTLTGAEIMDLADIPHSVGILLLNEDGTQRAVDPHEAIELKPGRRFKKAPRFKRG